MAVESRDLPPNIPAQPAPRPQQQEQRRSTQRRAARHTWGEFFLHWFVLIGATFAVLPFLVIFTAVNGGFSVAGLEVIAGFFNSGGRLFWALATTWTFDLPVAARIGLPVAQPVLPWIGVVGSNLLQIIAVYAKLKEIRMPWWFWALTGVSSLYDLGSTWLGLGTVGALASVWVVFRGVMAVFLTFIVEGIIGVLVWAYTKEW